MWKLFFFGIGLIILIYVIAYYLVTNSLKEDYEKDYDNLVQMVRKYKINKRNRSIIQQHFYLLKLYRCRNKKKIDVLYREFVKKFAI